MNDEKNYPPSFILGEIKKNKKGNEYFMFSGLYCEVFKSKDGRTFIRAMILPPSENKKSPDEKRVDSWWND